MMQSAVDSKDKRELEKLHRTCFGILEMTEDDVVRIIAERPDVFRDLKDMP